MIKLYVILSYVIIAFGAFLGLRHIDSLNDTITVQSLEIDSMKQSQAMLIDMYDQEIADLNKSVKERKVVIKEIVKNVKGTENEECIHRPIGDVIVDKLRKQNSDKKSTHSTVPKN